MLGSQPVEVMDEQVDQTSISSEYPAKMQHTKKIAPQDETRERTFLRLGPSQVRTASHQSSAWVETNQRNTLKDSGMHLQEGYLLYQLAQRRRPVKYNALVRTINPSTRVLVFLFCLLLLSLVHCVHSKENREIGTWIIRTSEYQLFLLKTKLWKGLLSSPQSVYNNTQCSKKVPPSPDVSSVSV